MKLKDYVKQVGTGTFADLIGVTAPFVSQLTKGRYQPSPTLCVTIEQKTMGRVTRQELRDDWVAIWPELVTDRAAA